MSEAFLLIASFNIKLNSFTTGASSLTSRISSSFSISLITSEILSSSSTACISERSLLLTNFSSKICSKFSLLHHSILYGFFKFQEICSKILRSAFSSAKILRLVSEFSTIILFSLEKL